MQSKIAVEHMKIATMKRVRECFFRWDTVSTEIIKPAKNDAEKRMSVPLSPVDYYSAPCTDIIASFVFREEQQGGGRLDIDRLKASLSLALAEHPYLAGHVTLQEVGEFGSRSNYQDKKKKNRSEKLKLEYSDRGVEWTNKVSRSSRRTVASLLPFIQFSESGKPNTIMHRDFNLPKLSPYYYKKVKDSTRYWKRKEYLMRVQLTQLVDGGSVLVVSASHLLTDLQPFKTLLRSWSNHYTLNASEGQLDVHRKNGFEQSNTVQCYFFDRSRPILDSMAASDTGKTPDPYEFLKVDKNEDVSWVVQGTRIFRYPMLGKLLAKSRFQAAHITRSQLDHVRQRAIQQIKSNCNSSNDISWVSDNDVLTATVWKLMAKRAPPDDMWMLYLTCTMRKRLQPPIPPDAWGNCTYVICISSIKRSDATRSIPELAAQVRESLNRFCSDKFEADIAMATSILLEEPDAVPNIVLNPKYTRLRSIKPRIPMMLTNWDFSQGLKEEVNFGGMTPVWMQPEDLRHGMLCVVTPCSSHIQDAGYILTFQVYMNAFKPRREECHEVLNS